MADHICGGSGTLSEAAKAELEEFRVHLTTHPKPHGIEGCRYCAARLSDKRFRPAVSVPISPPSPAETPDRMAPTRRFVSAVRRAFNSIPLDRAFTVAVQDAIVQLNAENAALPPIDEPRLIQSAPTETQTATPDSDYFQRNIRTVELANAVARFLGLNPADEIPFEELTRRLQFGPPRAAQPATREMVESIIALLIGGPTVEASTKPLALRITQAIPLIRRLAESPPSPSRDQTPSLPPARKRSYVRAVKYALDELGARLPADTNGMADLRCLRDWLAALPSPTMPSAPETK